MAKLQTFALYLAAGIEVAHTAWGRGQLVGLPRHLLYHTPMIQAAYPAQEHADGYNPGGVEVEEVSLSDAKPVLYELLTALFDVPGLLGPDMPPAVQKTLRNYSPVFLEEFAETVDYLRALGIALNLPPTDYIRKELPDAQ